MPYPRTAHTGLDFRIFIATAAGRRGKGRGSYNDHDDEQGGRQGNGGGARGEGKGAGEGGVGKRGGKKGKGARRREKEEAAERDVRQQVSIWPVFVFIVVAVQPEARMVSQVRNPDRVEGPGVEAVGQWASVYLQSMKYFLGVLFVILCATDSCQPARPRIRSQPRMWCKLRDVCVALQPQMVLFEIVTLWRARVSCDPDEEHCPWLPFLPPSVPHQVPVNSMS